LSLSASSSATGIATVQCWGTSLIRFPFHRCPGSGFSALGSRLSSKEVCQFPKTLSVPLRFLVRFQSSAAARIESKTFCLKSIFAIRLLLKALHIRTETKTPTPNPLRALYLIEFTFRSLQAMSSSLRPLSWSVICKTWPTIWWPRWPSPISSWPV